MSRLAIIAYSVALLASLAAAILAGFPGIVIFLVICAVGIVATIASKTTE